MDTNTNPPSDKNNDLGHALAEVINDMDYLSGKFGSFCLHFEMATQLKRSAKRQPSATRIAEQPKERTTR
jgi:hypothetical protein